MSTALFDERDSSPLESGEMGRHANELQSLLLESEVRLLESDLYSYVQDAWAQIEPYKPFRPNWHIEAICDHLMAVSNGDIHNLVINIPPRFLKSLTVSVFWPSWVWTRNPSIKWLFLSYGRSLVLRDAVKTRRLMQSPWYLERWGHVFQLASDQNVKAYYENDKGGARLTSSFESDPTGEGGDVLVVDDPLQITDAENKDAIDHVNEVWDGVLSTRLNDPVTGARVIIMQRLNEQDLTGHVLAEGGWTHLCLPQEFEKKRKCVVFLPKDLDELERPLPTAQPFFWDPRQEEGELLHPERFPRTEVDRLRSKGELNFSSQQQQRPAPAKGTIFQEQWWRYYKTLPEDLDMYSDACQSWDCSFKDLSSSSYVVCTVWARRGTNIYLLFRLRRKMNLPDTMKALESVTGMFPWIGAKYVEDRANGTAVIQMMSSKIFGIIPIQPDGGKESRAAAVSYMVQAGNVFLPDPEIAPWVKDEFIPELSSFPRSFYSDQVDSVTQALYHHFHLRPPAEISLHDLLNIGKDEPMILDRRVF